jgi:hypothetical protein
MTWVANELVCEGRHFYLECMRTPPDWHMWVYMLGTEAEAQRLKNTTNYCYTNYSAQKMILIYTMLQISHDHSTLSRGRVGQDAGYWLHQAAQLHRTRRFHSQVIKLLDFYIFFFKNN